MADLKVEHVWVVYPGRQTYRLSEAADAVSLAEPLEQAARMKS